MKHLRYVEINSITLTNGLLSFTQLEFSFLLTASCHFNFSLESLMAVAPGATFPFQLALCLPWNGGMAPWPYSYIQYIHAVVPREMTAGRGDLILE